MDLSKLIWVKNVKHKGTDKVWAYDNLEDMAIPQARIFCLSWRDRKSFDNARKPRKGDLMLLLQRAKVTHLVELIDGEPYKLGPNEWEICRTVQVLWMPPEGSNWEALPHQQKIFGYDYVVGDGAAHDLSAKDKMQQFHQYWDKKGGLKAFQRHVEKLLPQISLDSK